MNQDPYPNDIKADIKRIEEGIVKLDQEAKDWIREMREVRRELWTMRVKICLMPAREALRRLREKFVDFALKTDHLLLKRAREDEDDFVTLDELLAEFGDAEDEDSSPPSQPDLPN